jgi:cyclopropane-fatty-acyl-phospholipid synthase
VFPDGELHEIGSVVSHIQKAGFEARHVEGLREHYALTLRSWVHNLEAAWSQAVAEVGEGRARVWRLYMAASAVGFEDGIIQIHQVLAVRAEQGTSGLPLRSDFEPSHNQTDRRTRPEHPTGADRRVTSPMSMGG